LRNDYSSNKNSNEHIQTLDLVEKTRKLLKSRETGSEKTRVSSSSKQTDVNPFKRNEFSSKFKKSIPCYTNNLNNFYLKIKNDDFTSTNNFCFSNNNIVSSLKYQINKELSSNKIDASITNNNSIKKNCVIRGTSKSKLSINNANNKYQSLYSIDKSNDINANAPHTSLGYRDNLIESKYKGNNINNIRNGYLPSQLYTGSNKDLKLMPMPSSKLYNKNAFYSKYSILNEIK